MDAQCQWVCNGFTYTEPERRGKTAFVLIRAAMLSLRLPYDVPQVAAVELMNDWLAWSSAEGLSEDFAIVPPSGYMARASGDGNFPVPVERIISEYADICSLETRAAFEEADLGALHAFLFAAAVTTNHIAQLRKLISYSIACWPSIYGSSTGKVVGTAGSPTIIVAPTVPPLTLYDQLYNEMLARHDKDAVFYRQIEQASALQIESENA